MTINLLYFEEANKTIWCFNCSKVFAVEEIEVLII